MTTLPMLFTLFLTVLLVGCGPRLTPDRSGDAATSPEEQADRPNRVAPDTSDDDDAEKDRVEVAPDVQTRLGIAVAPVTPQPLSVALRLTGSVRPIESRLAHVRPLAQGRILEVLARMGDHVSRGQPLARFDNVEAGTVATERDRAQAELARLRIQLGTATRQAERARRLSEIGAAPQREYETSLGELQQIEASIRAQETAIAGLGVRLRRFGTESAAADASSVANLSSPIAGILVHAAAAPGDVVDATTDLFTVADISRLYVEAQVFERDLAAVRKGQTATITVDAYPDERWPGTVAVVGAALDPQTRTVPVRIEVVNVDDRLKLDMFARVALATEATEQAIAVPREAVQLMNGRPVVFVRSSDTAFRVRHVGLGRLSGRLTEIAEGLSAGEVVVTTGAFKLKSIMLASTLGDNDDDRKDSKR